MTMETERWTLVGASRGLGRAVVDQLVHETSDLAIQLISRKFESLETLQNNCRHPLIFESLDLSKSQDQQQCLQRVQSFRPHRLLYFAAGGPYGRYSEKNWKDHLWCFETSFLFPAQLFHMALSHLPETWQILAVGSLVADSSPDPGAASYAAAKHALKGLVSTLQKEEPKKDIRLYRPGYMDTSLLPPKARPRVQGEVILHPEMVAKDLVRWLNDEQGRSTTKEMGPSAS